MALLTWYLMLSIQSRYHVLMAARLSVVNVACCVCMKRFISASYLFPVYVCACVLLLSEQGRIHCGGFGVFTDDFLIYSLLND